MRNFILVSAILGASMAVAAPATPPTGNHVDQRLDRRGDRIDRRRGGSAD